MDIEAAMALNGEGFSRRKIARMLGVSRNTLRKYLTPDATASSPDGGKLAAHLDALSEMLSTKPEARSMELFRKLADQGYSGSYDLVKRKVREIRRGFLPDAAPSEPGRRASADLGRITLAGKSFWLFTLSLDFSGRIYSELSARVDLDSFLQWHLRAFRFFQGVPAEVAYEKSRNRVFKALVGAGGVNLPFSRFAAHHGFTPVDAPPFHPWAAGRLKRPLRLIETLFLRGNSLKTLEGANTALLGWLLGREADSPGNVIKDRFGLERDRLGPLRKSEPTALKPRLHLL